MNDLTSYKHEIIQVYYRFWPDARIFRLWKIIFENDFRVGFYEIQKRESVRVQVKGEADRSGGRSSGMMSNVKDEVRRRRMTLDR